MAVSVEIRRCTLDDLDQLASIALKTFNDTFAHLNDPQHFLPYLKKAFSPKKISSELTNSASEFYFLFSDDRLAGYLKVNFAQAQSDIRDIQSLEIERIYVLQQFHGSGLGQALFQFSLNIAKTRNLQYIWLGVWEKNTNAIEFYQSRGFYKFAAHPFKLGDDLQTDYLMRLDL